LFLRIFRRDLVKLWREHLKTSDSDLSSSEQSNFYNFEEGFKAWEKLAEESGKKVKRRESIHGHVYYYNATDYSRRLSAD
jgi:hypothetical protein